MSGDSESYAGYAQALRWGTVPTSERTLGYPLLIALCEYVGRKLDLALVGSGRVYAVTLGLQAAFGIAALLGAVIPLRPLRLAHYYAVVEGSILVGLWDRLRSGTAVTWERAEGTR